MKDELKLEFPRAKDYISVARLATAFVASLKDLDMDTIEDLRLMITEACNLCYFLACEDKILLKIKIEDQGFYFGISSLDQEKIKEKDHLQMSEAIIQSLADGVKYEKDQMVIYKDISG